MNRKILNDIRKAMSRRSLLYLSERMNCESKPPGPTKSSRKESDLDKSTTKPERLKDKTI